MHPNEVNFVPPVLGAQTSAIDHAATVAGYYAMAEKLGPKYQEALKIQILRQGGPITQSEEAA